MREITHTIYTYDELEPRVQQAVLENLVDMNVDHDDWWRHYEDYCQVNIQEFDLFRRECKVNFTDSASKTARHIETTHGGTGAMRASADAFLRSMYKLEARLELASDDEASDIEAEMDILSEDYQRDLSQQVLDLLESEYEHLTSEDAIIETIEANELEFYADGRIA